MAKVNSYQRGKENARNEAKNWQFDTMNKSLFWSDLAEAVAKFEKLAKRFGLIREFRENAII